MCQFKLLSPASSTLDYYSGLTGEVKVKYDGKMKMISTTIDPYCILEKKSGPSSSCSLISSVEWHE